MSASKTRKAIGIVRVSQTGGREGESFVSPSEQEERIRDACKREGFELLEPITEELDVSGGTPLDRREGLRAAIEAVEAGEAQVIVAAYFDRLVRSLRVQDELVSRVEAAGGQVLAVDVGAVTNGSAGQWLSSTMLGAVSEYQRRSVKERSAEGQARAIARGAAPWPHIPPGYRRKAVPKSDPDFGKLEPDPETAPVVAEAFRKRAGGASVKAVREYLRQHGVERSFHAVSELLNSRVVLGEVHFGKYEPNLEAHEPIVDREVWQAVQRVRVPRGRKAKSKRLLARLGVVRCATCGSRMVVGASNNGKNPTYRCPATNDCKRRATINAEIVEEAVIDAVRQHVADEEGRASAERNVREAEQTLERAQAELDAGIRTLAGFEDEDAARDRLADLRAARDDARERLEALGGAKAAVTVSATTDWDRLSLRGRRDLIRATVAQVTVTPGRSPDRITIELLGE